MLKIQSVKASNFASYKELTFDFRNQGLTLIQGATGSGKSTLCDLTPWVLFGKTAKGGAVSEVLTWPGKDTTEVIATLEVKNRRVTIVRTRGKNNDLYYHQEDDFGASIMHQRGKDIPDTQRLINQIIGMDYDLYLASAYYHEFSQTAQFFTTTAKTRRAICEQLVDLTLPKKLQLKASEELKELRKKEAHREYDIKAVNGKASLLQRLQASENAKAETWDITHEANKEAALRQYKAFEANRKKTISKKCQSCGTVLQHPHEVHDTSENPYTTRMLDLEAAVNPYTGTVKDYSTEIAVIQAEEAELTQSKAEISTEIMDLDILLQVASSFRAISIENTIRDVETKTNTFLSKHFDAELRVEFDITDGDKLEVLIYKDGNTCSYTQLSKGQRCLLKLCFGISVMEAVANHHSITPSQLFFDESLSGLDDKMKVKAINMIETLSLSYDSVFVVEHSSAAKEAFNNKYTVELTNEGSVIAKT